LILTGRAVGAEEAFVIGLANRIAPPGAAREAAESLALELSALPQTCLRGDRLSAREGLDLGFDDAMANEFRHGVDALASPDALEGAERFAARTR
jgi:enoyl-CoA hydratase